MEEKWQWLITPFIMVSQLKSCHLLSIWNENVFNEKKKLSCWSAHWLPDKLSALLSTSWSKNEEYSLHYSNATDGVTKYTLHNLYWCINTSWPVCLVSFAAASTCSAAVWSPKRLPWHQNSLNSSGANSALRKDYIQTENTHTYILAHPGSSIVI